jgi:hypothetical protein
LFVSEEHPGDVQYLKMLQEERQRSKGSRSRHPVQHLILQPIFRIK